MGGEQFKLNCAFKPEGPRIELISPPFSIANL